MWHGSPDILIEAGGTTIAIKNTDDKEEDDPETKKKK